MEYSERQEQSEPERRGQGDVLKQRIEAAYQGSSTPTAPAASPSVSRQ
ncbi:hypothetical protein [Streptomyces durocortorensis]|nr:hypothetical protein [Streptomyces durocortorensis]